MKEILALINRTYEQGISDSMLWMFTKACARCQREITEYLVGLFDRRAIRIDRRFNLLSPVESGLKAALVKALTNHKDAPVSQRQR